MVHQVHQGTPGTSGTRIMPALSKIVKDIVQQPHKYKCGYETFVYKGIKWITETNSHIHGEPNLSSPSSNDAEPIKRLMLPVEFGPNACGGTLSTTRQPYQLTVVTLTSFHCLHLSCVFHLDLCKLHGW